MPRTPRTTRSTTSLGIKAAAASAATTGIHSTAEPTMSPYFCPSQTESTKTALTSASDPVLTFAVADAGSIHYPTDPLERANATRGPELDAKGRKKPSKVSTFDFKVYDALLKIPKGKLTTYAALAAYIGGHPRAVGQALRRNPYAPYVPCHRVISSDFKLGGFNGATGQCTTTMRKYNLLIKEGAIVVPAPSGGDSAVAGKTKAVLGKDMKVQVVSGGLFDWSTCSD